MTEEEFEMRRERHAADMEKIRAEIARMGAEVEKMGADVALARREARFPSTMLAAFVLAIIGPWLLSLVN